MAFFKKKVTPRHLGDSIYANIRYGVMTKKTVLSEDFFLDQIEIDSNELADSYIFEMLIGLMFGAEIAVLEHFKVDGRHEIKEAVIKAMKDAFVAHAKQAQKDVDDSTIEGIVEKRFDQYYEAYNHENPPGPIYHIGKHYYKHITGKECPSKELSKICGDHVFESVGMVNDIMKKHKFIEDKK